MLQSSMNVHEQKEGMASSAIKQVRFGPLSAAYDVSNDSYCKLHPLVITYFNPVENLFENNLLSIPNLTDSGTSEIINLILKEFKEMNIPFENCVAFMTVLL